MGTDYFHGGGGGGGGGKRVEIITVKITRSDFNVQTSITQCNDFTEDINKLDSTFFFFPVLYRQGLV